jgi:hypothetical protein
VLVGVGGVVCVGLGGLGARSRFTGVGPVARHLFYWDGNRADGPAGGRGGEA